MASSSILMILALLIFVALVVARPFLGGSTLGQEQEGKRSAMLAERERILEALLELDFDQELGKVPEEIYTVQREKLLQQGAKILELLDKEPGGADSSTAVEPVDDLEAMIAARKGERGK